MADIETDNPRCNLKRFGQSFRHGTHSTRNRIRNEAIEQMRRATKVPKWVQISHKFYREYGLKHLLLIGVLIAYQLLGATVFYMCEYDNEQSMESDWNKDLKNNRSILIKRIVYSMFNNTDYLFFLTEGQTKQIESRLQLELKDYENQVGVKFQENKMKLDFYSAILYCQMICTTIGGGFVHVFPKTSKGRLFTIFYSIFGIPLVLVVLDDMGKLLTKALKNSWYSVRCGCRRLFRSLTKQSISEINKLDAEDKRDLEMFQLPILISILIVVGWIGICSSTFMLWEKDWNYFNSFYFFFISFSTIGTGDFSPNRQPKYLLILFVYIIIGLSLVSILVNSIQTKFESTYLTGQNQLLATESFGSEIHRSRSSLGVLKGFRSSVYSITRERVQHYFANKQSFNKSSQTMLSFPSPTRNSMVSRTVYKNRIFPRTLSIDDVMKLVDTEEGDILLLTELSRDMSGLSELTDISQDSSINQLVVSKSFDSNFNSSQMPIESSYLPSLFNSSRAFPRKSTRLTNSDCPSTVPIPLSLEVIEEMEDLLLLRTASFDAEPTVHFRSRLSLVNEEECGASTISTSTTDQTLSENQGMELDKNANRNMKRNKAHFSTIASTSNNNYEHFIH